jgi:hypothetical protein
LDFWYFIKKKKKKALEEKGKTKSKDI